MIVNEGETKSSLDYVTNPYSPNLGVLTTFSTENCNE